MPAQPLPVAQPAAGGWWPVVGAAALPEPLNIDLKRWFDKLTTNGAGARYPFVLSLSKDRWSRH
jgi:hypothetical protein